jgi:hypothetical protein
MSASHEWTEYHLMPRGWEQGSWKIDFGDVHKKDPPPDRFLTCVYHEKLSSVFSKMNRYVDETWRSNDSAKLSELSKEFGECPNSL